MGSPTVNDIDSIITETFNHYIIPLKYLTIFEHHLEPNYGEWGTHITAYKDLMENKSY